MPSRSMANAPLVKAKGIEDSYARIEVEVNDDEGAPAGEGCLVAYEIEVGGKTAATEELSITTFSLELPPHRWPKHVASAGRLVGESEN